MAETPQQDLSRREFEALFPGFSAAMRSLRANGFQQVTIHEGQEFPQIRGFVQTGPSVLSSYNNEIGPAIPAIDSINGDGIGGGGYADPGEGGDGGSGVGGSGGRSFASINGGGKGGSSRPSSSASREGALSSHEPGEQAFYYTDGPALTNMLR